MNEPPTSNFTVRLSAQVREVLDRIARKRKSTAGDTIRQLILEAAKKGGSK